MDSAKPTVPIRAYDRLSTAKQALPEALRDLARELGLPGGARLCVVQLATTERHGRRGRHARIWKHYNPDLARALHDAWDNQVHWEASTYSHYLDESALAAADGLEQLKAVLSPFCSHIAIEDADVGTGQVFTTGATLGIEVYERLPTAAPTLFDKPLRYPKFVAIEELGAAVTAAARLDKRHTLEGILVFSVPPSILRKDAGETVGRLYRPRYWAPEKLSSPKGFQTRLPLLLVKAFVVPGGPRVLTYDPLKKQAVLRAKDEPSAARGVERDYIASQRHVALPLIHQE